MTDSLPDAVLDRPRSGVGIPDGSTLRRLLADSAPRPTILALVRHLGCPFCRQMVAQIGRAADAGGAEFPGVLIGYMGTVAAGRRFFASRRPGVRAIADTDRDLYRALGAPRGSLVQLFGPAALACGVGAFLRHGVGVPNAGADPLQLPGAALLGADGSVLRVHTARHGGDHPNWAELAREPVS
jgi:hypothetical protein